jgi:hypothetical protein
MTTLLECLPPHPAGQHQAIFQRLRACPASRAKWSSQGDDGDYFYIIVRAVR